MIKLRKLQVEGFRGARLPLKLDFTSSYKSVIVYGTNGSGKSTFSDAVEWFFRQRVNYLWREDCFEEALRNLNLTQGQNAIVGLEFSDGKLDCEQILDGNLGVKRSNRSVESKDYISASEAERLVLRHGDLQDFITKSKGEKKKVIADIIGYDDIVDFRNNLTSAFNKIQNDPEFAAARKTLEANRGKMMGRFKGFIESDTEVYSLASKTIAPFNLDIKVTDWNTYDEAIKMVEGRVTAQEKGAARVVLSTAISKCGQAKSAVTKAVEQVEEFSKQYEKVLATKEKVIQLNLEDFLKSGRKILDEGWAKQGVCPFCGGEVDFEHLRQELNKRIDELSGVREEFESITKSKGIAVNYCEASERHVREVLGLSAPYGPEDASRDELSGFCKEVLTLIDQIQESFRTYTRLPEIRSIGTCSDTVRQLLDSEMAKFDQKAKQLELTSEETAALAALESLKELRNLFQDNTQLSKVSKGFQHQIASLSKIREAFVEVQNSILQEVLDMMSDDIGRHYRAMHPQEEVDNVRLKIVGDEGVEFRYSFHGMETGPPLKYLSESHLNSLGIALFLAAVKLFNKRNGFMVLDDVVTSFDSDHRMRLLRLLEDEFSHYQIILLTHESFWFESIREELGALGWLVKEVEWDYDNGIRWVSGSADIRKLIAQKKTQQLPIGNDIRKLLERRLKDICLGLRVRMAYLPNDQNERRMVGELLSELRSTLNEKKCQVKDSPVLARLSTTKFLTSVQSHDNTEEPSSGDLEVALSDVDALDALFQCPECKGLVSVKYERPAEKRIYCKCGEMSVEWC